jgi:hypothetical protein
MLTINRRAAFPRRGMMYLPVSKQLSDAFDDMRRRIDVMCSEQRRNQVFTEDIRDLVRDVLHAEFEFPKHLLEPVFLLINQKIRKAIKVENIYHLEILIDTLRMLDAYN